MVIFVFPDGSVGRASTQREAIRRFRGFIEEEEIALPDPPNSDSVVPTPIVSASAPAPAPDDSSDNS